ncbi:MAG: hypothetical protein JSW16_02140 [Dehalococcoidales bacterium]|nr:MAG: hypothetical protein JSW16_02140 [Dehalococcoidales bacterium]
MNIGYDNSFSKDSPITYAHIIDPFGRQREYNRDLRNKYRSENDPERPPKRGPGDKYILIGALTGLIIGGVSVAIVGGIFFGFIGGVLGFLGGFIAGGITGVMIGDSVRKRRLGLKD